MRLLFSIDKKDYEEDWVKFYRPSSRGIYINNNKIAMIYSKKYNYYKLPGGGIENGENKIDALIREVKEEAGLIIKSFEEFGYVHRIQKSTTKDKEIFIQDNYYYIIECEDKIIDQHLDDYEKEESFLLQFINPIQAIKINRDESHGNVDQTMLERDAMVLELLIKNEYFKEG